MSQSSVSQCVHLPAHSSWEHHSFQKRRTNVRNPGSALQEDFLDLSLTVAGSSGAEQSLREAYQEVEMLDGRNQYKCSNCDKLVDAKKVSLC